MTGRSIIALAMTAVAAAACSAPPGPQATGSITGTVTSAGTTPLSGVTVTATPSGGGNQVATTTANGTYSIGSVPSGSGTVSLSNLPTGCTAASKPYAVSANGHDVVDFSATCPQSSTGTVTGTVENSLGGGIANAQVTVTPASGTAPPSTHTDANGRYSVANVPVGTGAGTVSVTSVPTNCTAPAPQAYSGLTAGQTVVANLRVTCTAPNAAVMWVGDQVNSINGFTAAQIATSGAPTPLGIDVAIPGTAALAFDAQGNLWVAAGYGCTPTGGSGCGGNVTGYLFEYTPAQLASNGNNVSPTVTIALPAPFSGQATFPYGLAFDRNGTLWVTGSNQLVLYGFGANQLSTSGSPTPAHALTVATSAGGLSGLAFDASGNLWIGVQSDPNGSNGGGAIIELSPSQLGAASGTPTPVDSLIGAGATVGIATPNFLAFDTHGNLWVSGSQDTVVMFSNASLLALGTSSSPAAAVTLTTPFTAFPEGLAFDGSGNLWLSLFPQGGPHQTAVIRYPASAIASGGSGASDITLSLTSNSQSAPLGGLSGIAFAPGAGQALFGSAARGHQP